MKNKEPQNNQMKQITEIWIKPEITVASVTEETQGDPTISDDGLGDGLFS